MQNRRVAFIVNAIGLTFLQCRSYDMNFEAQ
jgi:hypothetical protein